MQRELQINNLILNRISLLNQKGCLAHAYLFIGPRDIGKGETAIAIAKMINCEGGSEELFCDTCSPCKQIGSGNHPDVVVIDNEYGEAIKIGQIRELMNQSKLKAYYSEKKVFIIKNIEYMTQEAANAFLKTLEEPSAGSLVLLTTSVPEKVLDTVRSRCHAIPFQLMSSNALKMILMEKYRLNEQESHLISYFSQGCLGTAQKLSRNGFIERKDQLIDLFILNRPEDVDIKNLLAEKKIMKEFLDILFSWMRDCLLVKVGVDDIRLVHHGRLSDLKQFSMNYSFEELKALNESTVKMHRLFADNLNIKLPLLIIGEQIWEKS